MKKISIIAPCYNEEDNIINFYNKVNEVLKEVKVNYEIIFINDGSKDKTLLKLNEVLNIKKSYTKVINFSRNFGKEAAMYAGLSNSTGDYSVIIDTDLQQDPKLIIDMFNFLETNLLFDSVACYQKQRKESGFMRFFKKKFYKMINNMSEVDFVDGASDFRMINRKMCDSILSLQEKNRFSKGIFSWVGFNTYYMPYKALQREKGVSKWSYSKLFKYAMDGIISFSNAPLKIATILGTIFSFSSFIYILVILIQKIFFGIDVKGYATIVILILLLGGIQLLVLGIIGEYLSKVYTETKNRPIYIIESIRESIYDKRNKKNISEK